MHLPWRLSRPTRRLLFPNQSHIESDYGADEGLRRTGSAQRVSRVGASAVREGCCRAVGLGRHDKSLRVVLAVPSPSKFASVSLCRLEARPSGIDYRLWKGDWCFSRSGSI